MSPRAWAGVLALACALGPTRLKAQVASECSTVARRALREAGAEPLRAAYRGFLVHGEAHALPLHFDRAGCVGVLAVAASEVAMFRLSLVTPEGNTLVERERESRSAYLRYCGAEGLSLVAIARVVRGQGELRLSAHLRAPEALPDLGAACGEAEGLTTQPVALGPAPALASLTERVATAQSFARRFGYLPEWSVPVESSAIPLHTAPGECFALQLAAEQRVRGLELRVEGAGWSRRERSQNVSELWLSFCADEAGEAHIHASEEGRRLTLLRLPPRGSAPALTRGDARLAYRELSYLVGRRGLSLRLLAQGMSAPGEVLRLPVTLPVAGCYAFALSPAEELVGADLDLILSDAHGNLLARELMSVDQPLIFHCGEGQEQLRLSIRARSAAGRYNVLMASTDARARGEAP